MTTPISDELKVHPLVYDPKHAMILGLKHVLPIERAKRIVKCVNFFASIPDEKLKDVMVELKEYYDGIVSE